jgi:hypothetical protein
MNLAGKWYAVRRCERSRPVQADAGPGRESSYERSEPHGSRRTDKVRHTGQHQVRCAALDGLWHCFSSCTPQTQSTVMQRGGPWPLIAAALQGQRPRMNRAPNGDVLGVIAYFTHCI